MSSLALNDEDMITDIKAKISLGQKPGYLI